MVHRLLRMLSESGEISDDAEESFLDLEEVNKYDSVEDAQLFSWCHFVERGALIPACLRFWQSRLLVVRGRKPESAGCC